MHSRAGLGAFRLRTAGKGTDIEHAAATALATALNGTDVGELTHVLPTGKYKQNLIF